MYLILSFTKILFKPYTPRLPKKKNLTCEQLNLTISYCLTVDVSKSDNLPLRFCIMFSRDDLDSQVQRGRR